jgi:hypothetical protein
MVDEQDNALFRGKSTNMKKKEKQKNPAAAARPEKNLAAVMLGQRRWLGVSQEERHAHAQRIGALGGRPRKEGVERCPCGNMTLHTAILRAGVTGTSKGHKRGCRFYKKPERPREVA